MLNPLNSIIGNVFNISGQLLYSTSFRFVYNQNHMNKISINLSDKKNISDNSNKVLDSIENDMKPFIDTMESDLRYGWIDELLLRSSFKKIKVIEYITRSEKIDKVLTHTWFGPLIFISI